MKSQTIRIVVLFALTMLLGVVAFGQTSPLSGTVTDPKGDVVAGATVIVKNIGTGNEFRAVSTAQGLYTVPALAVGTYTVTIEAKGFKTTVVNDVKVDVGAPATVNATMELGAATETVTIQGGGEVLQTQSANVSTTITGRQITDLPFTSRDALDLVLSLPGTSTPGRPRTSTINGLPKGALNITLDGVNIQDNTLKSSDGFFTFVRARIDAVDEVTLSTATPGAESSGEGAVQLKFVTRSGNNDFHGSIYGYHRNPWLNANYWYTNRDGAPYNPATASNCTAANYNPDVCKAQRARVLLNQDGFRFGGPIWIPGVFKGTDKAFFFVNYELYLLPEATFRARTILSPQAQSGIFQYVTSTGTQSVNLLNLATTATAGGCTACTNTLDPTTSKLLSDIRNSTNGVGDVKALSDPNLNTFSFINKGGQDRVFPTVRLDFNITPKHHLENIWNYNYFGGLVDFLNGVDPAFPGFPNHGSQVSRRFSNVTALRSTLTSTLVNEARYGITGGTVLFFAEVNPGQFSNQGGYNLGIGAAGITSATVTNGPSRRNAPVKQFTDTLTWTKGSHSLNFGGTFSQINFWGIAQTMVPSISFGIDTSDPATSMFTSANFPGASAAQISSAAALYSVLTGHVTAINGNARLDEKTNQYKYLGPQTERDRQREFGLFLQDSWRFRPNLTLTGGLRWEVQMPFQALNNSYSKVTWNALWGESGPGNLFKPGTLAGSPTTYSNFVPGDTTYTTQYKNVAPSVGFAWTPNVKNSLLKKIVGDGGQTVVRGGYSIAYNREGMNVVSSILAANPGIAITTNRNLTLGNLVGGSLGSQPLLLRESARLGAPAFVSAPTYPNSGLITDSANAFNPNLKMGYVQSWSFGVQRELSKDTVVEVRYVGNRGVKLWNQYSLNEVNNIENGFLNEFKLAQANLQANIAAGRGSNFKYFGAGTGTSPLPIMMAFISGLPASAAGTASNYSSTLWSNATFVNALAINGPSIGTFSGIGTSQGNFITNATFRNNGIAAGLPANFFLANPGKLGGAFTIENNGRTWYDAGVLEVRRRMSKGLLVQGSYTFTKSTINAPVSSSAVFYQPRSLRNLNDKTLSPFGITHAVKANWIYEMPFGKGKTFLNGVGGAMNQLVGGWEFHGLARLQSGSPNDFGNVQLVGLTRNDLQSAMAVRFDNANKISYYLPQDIIDNTIKAFNVSATSTTGYSTLGVPSGRYIAPASNATCIEGYNAQCGSNHLILYGPKFARFDLSVVKKFKITERANFEFRAEFLNAFNNINFLLGSAGNDVTAIGGFGSTTFGQFANAYQDTSTTNDPGGRMVQFVARINF